MNNQTLYSVGILVLVVALISCAFYTGKRIDTMNTNLEKMLQIEEKEFKLLEDQVAAAQEFEQSTLAQFTAAMSSIQSMFDPEPIDIKQEIANIVQRCVNFNRKNNPNMGNQELALRCAHALMMNEEH